MGLVQVTVTIRNPAEPERSWDGLFLVDTGSTDCVVPGRALREIGIRPKGRRTYELADGREETVDIAVAEVEFMGEIVGATVGFGNDHIEPILGLTALESVGIEIDPVSHGTNVSGERQRPGAVGPWETSGAGPQAEPKAPAVGHSQRLKRRPSVRMKGRIARRPDQNRFAA